MKILVFAHRLELGGTQVNAIELAAALRDVHGHEVVLFATPGPMNRMAEDKGLRFIPAPDARFHPSVARMRALRRVARDERPEVVHVWDWWQCLEAYCALHLSSGVPMVVTDMMMDLTRVLPKGLLTTFGTPELVDQARSDGRANARLLLPPVDVRLNAPDAVDGAPLRQRLEILDDEILVVTVSRLASFMKAESLRRTIDVVRELASQLPLRFVIVGDGAERQKLQELADAANRELGRQVIDLSGALVDPRQAYAAADIVVGMGGSALRAMAFAKPVVVVGERGFANLFSAESAARFLYTGMYGLGDSSPGNANLSGHIRHLCAHPEVRAQVGHFSRSFVLEHFAIERVSAQLSVFLDEARKRDASTSHTWRDFASTSFTYLQERRYRTPSRDPVAAEKR
jgi:L-malate glycosyltransferase